MKKDNLTIPSKIQEVLRALGNASNELAEYTERTRECMKKRLLDDGESEVVANSIVSTSTNDLEKAHWKMDEAIDHILGYVSESIKEEVYE